MGRKSGRGRDKKTRTSRRHDEHVTASGRWTAVHTAVASVTAVAALAVAVIALRQDGAANEADERDRRQAQAERSQDQAEARTSDPVIRGYEAKTTDDITYLITDREGEQPYEVPGDGATVDFLVENLNGQAGLIEAVSITIEDVDELSTCGAGPALATADYDFRVPVTPSSAGETILIDEPPFVLTGDTVERFTVSVGPDKLTESRFAALYYFDVTLHMLSGNDLVAEDIVLMDPGDNDIVIDALSVPGPREDCVGLNLSVMQRFMEYPFRTRSERMAELYRRLGELCTRTSC